MDFLCSSFSIIQCAWLQRGHNNNYNFMESRDNFPITRKNLIIIYLAELQDA